MTEEEHQKELECYCKMCKQNTIFVTSLSPVGDLICGQCRYSNPITPFKMIENQFGCSIIRGVEK